VFYPDLIEKLFMLWTSWTESWKLECWAFRLPLLLEEKVVFCKEGRQSYLVVEEQYCRRTVSCCLELCALTSQWKDVVPFTHGTC
jgi:hypothetical protein